LLKACLASIFASTKSAIVECVVIDNASSDHSIKMLQHDFPAVQLIRNSENLGFGRANNQGWQTSHSKYILFLNSDTLVPPGTLAQLIEFMNSHPDAGVVGPRLVRADGTTQPYAFGNDPTPSYLLKRGFKRLVLHRALHDWETRAPQLVDWVSGACLLARHDALERVGGFDENFFMYFEDNDLCLRIKQAGWKIYYDPQATITHLGGASVAQDSARTLWYDKSLRYFYTKHYNLAARLYLKLFFPIYHRMNRG
jgi:GT2 family glycosyltransferase